MNQENSSQLQCYHIDQSGLIGEFVSLMPRGYSDPLNLFLHRIIEVICQIFKFKRSTLALLDFRRNVYMKLAMISYGQNNGMSLDRKIVEVPQQVIDRIFHDRNRIKVLYYDHDQHDDAEVDNLIVPERKNQRRRPLDEWHARDLILLNLKDCNDRSYGYISLDEPLDDFIPARLTFQNLELIAQLVGMSIENYYRFSVLAKKNHRMRQILANSNIFKLHLNLTSLLNEIVWSAKYNLDFNLVALVLISKKTQLIETRAVACDDKIKQTQLLALTFASDAFSDLLKDEYLIGKSYLVSREEFVLGHFKQIYYDAETRPHPDDDWPQQTLLLVPIRSREEKIIGFFMADDPQDSRLPTPETRHTLEILANQIAVAIDNRIMYVQAKGSSPSHQSDSVKNSDFTTQDFTRGGFKKIVEHFLR